MRRLCAPSLLLQVLIDLLLDPILAARQVRVHLVAEPAGRGRVTMRGGAAAGPYAGI